MSDRPPRTPTLYGQFQTLKHRQSVMGRNLLRINDVLHIHMGMPHALPQPELGQQLDRLERMVGRLQRVMMLMAIALLLVVGLHFWR